MFESQTGIKAFANNVYLTQDSMELEPHLDTIAMIDTGEAAIGSIHGHEAGNGMRSPGRVMNDPSGGMEMFRVDEASEGGSEKLYGKVPTPAVMHNYYTREVDRRQPVPSLKNGGIVFKGISRYKHSVYHFGAGLPGADLERFQSKELLFQKFPAVATAVNVFSSAEQAELMLSILKKVDSRFVTRRGYPTDVGLGHAANLEDSRIGFYDPNPKVVTLDLTQEEIDYWGTGVPGQKCSVNDTMVIDCPKTIEEAEMKNTQGGFLKAEVWEQFAYAEKLLSNGLLKTIALEFDFMDLHGDGARPETVLRDQGKQASIPLARIITKLKASGVYDRTLIAVYTLDGSRTPEANSYGNNGKGTMLLAGGMIKGGYYGDIQIMSNEGAGHKFALVPPDPTSVDGRLLAPVANWDDKAARTPSGAAWRTVMKAAGVPDAVITEQNFTDEVTNAKPLQFMLRS
jgi:hypothetical protein